MQSMPSRWIFSTNHSAQRVGVMEAIEEKEEVSCQYVKLVEHINGPVASSDLRRKNV